MAQWPAVTLPETNGTRESRPRLLIMRMTIFHIARRIISFQTTGRDIFTRGLNRPYRIPLSPRRWNLSKIVLNNGGSFARGRWEITVAIRFPEEIAAVAFDGHSSGKLSWKPLLLVVNRQITVRFKMATILHKIESFALNL